MERYEDAPEYKESGDFTKGAINHLEQSLIQAETSIKNIKESINSCNISSMLYNFEELGASLSNATDTIFGEAIIPTRLSDDAEKRIYECKKLSKEIINSFPLKCDCRPKS